MFEAVFFDMDGVTIDSEPQWQRSETTLMERFGYIWSEEDQAHCVGGPLTRVGEYMALKSGSQLNGSWFMEQLISIQMEAMRDGAELLPGVSDFVQQCRDAHVPVALVSASPRNIVDSVLSALPKNFFDFSISSDEVVRTKPDPLPYLTAAKRLGVQISASLIIEDSKTGIQSAKSAGAYILAIPHFFSLESTSRMKVVKTLEGISIAELYANFK